MTARRLGGLLAIVAIAALGTTPAGAGTFTASAASCAGQVLEQPFLPWLDPAQYVLAPSGTFERAGEWRLAGGAAVVAGNESFRVHADSDSRSLALPSGSTATSRAMCVGLEHPTLRLFARNTGSPLSTLKVEVLFEDVLGAVRVAPIGTLAARPDWQPTAPLALLANVPGSILSSSGTTAVAFRFVPLGSGGAWQIDDVYVDPFRGR